MTETGWKGRPTAWLPHLNNTPRFNAALEDADLIVNATALGLKPTDPSPVPSSLFSAHHLVYDLQTHNDAFQMEARFQGARTANGPFHA